MRPLTVAEMDIVAGGDGNTTTGSTITVTGTRPPKAYSPILPTSGGGGGGSPGGGGGGGGGTPPNVTGPARAGQLHKTREGHTYIAGIDLTLDQTNNLDKIVDYGLDHGLDKGEIRTVATIAFQESSLNTATTGTNRSGLGQYDQSTWNQLGETGSINNVNDQVAALYHDYAFFNDLYNTAVQSDAYGINESGLNLAEYIEYKHHYGRSATDWQQQDPLNGQTTKQEFDGA